MSASGGHHDRHHRQKLLPFVGEDGQRRLRDSHAVIVGVGALGCPAADLLARAGVGRITLIDRDIVDRTNLQRQTLFTDADARDMLPKAEAARRRLLAIDPSLTVAAHIEDCTHRTAERLLDGAQVLLDCTDNYEARYLLNDVSVHSGTPLVYGGAVSSRGMRMTVLPGIGPCLRCVFPEPPDEARRETCDTVGVLGPVASVIGAMQAAEAIKVLLGRTDAASRVLTRLDLFTNEHAQVDLSGARDPVCPCCGEREFSFLRGESGGQTTTLCGRGGVQITPTNARVRLDLDALAQRLAPHGDFTATPFVLRGELTMEETDQGDPVELTAFRDGRAIVSVPDFERARAIYAKYIGA